MTTSNTSQALVEVIAAMPAEGYVTAKELWRQMKRWAPGTIRHVLYDLHLMGKVDRETQDLPGGCIVHRYRRKAG